MRNPQMLVGGETLYRRAWKDRPWEDLKDAERAMWAEAFEAAMDAYYEAAAEHLRTVNANAARLALVEDSDDCA